MQLYPPSSPFARAHTQPFQRAPHPPLQPLHQPSRERIPKRRVRNDARALEEARGPHPLRAVDDLRGQREVARGDLLAQRADRAEGDDGAYAEGLERCDARARGDGGGGEGVVLAVPGEEGDFSAGGERGDCYGGGGEAPGLWGSQFFFFF